MLAWSEVLLIVIAILVVLGLWGWWYANRLDRLHRKVLASRMALDAQLVRRAAAAAQFANAGYLDPVTSLLIISAAHDATASSAAADGALFDAIPELIESARTSNGAPVSTPSRAAVARRLDAGGMGSDRIWPENELTQAVREALSDEHAVTRLYAEPGSAEGLDTLAAAWYRAQLARRFHNESVAQVRQLRRNVLIRVFHLAGHAPLPQSVDLDDAWPGLLRAPDGAVTQ